MTLQGPCESEPISKVPSMAHSLCKHKQADPLEVVPGYKAQGGTLLLQPVDRCECLVVLDASS